MSGVNVLAGLFSAGQITGIVLLCLIIAALIAVNGYLAYLLRKRGEHKLHTVQLQQQRMALLEKLNALRSGVPLEELPTTMTPTRTKRLRRRKPKPTGKALS